MNRQSYKIVVSGDICINALLWTTSPQVRRGRNWQMHDNMHKTSMPGESILLARLISLATGRSVLAPQMRKESMCSNEFLHSTAKVERFPRLPGQGHGIPDQPPSRFYMEFTRPAQTAACGPGRCRSVYGGY
ncbi:MAG: hypothetical protein RQM92_14635 [Candidatus Syntrophopropionicum ammoniitolerans]